jgi:hypothetical protein
MSQNFQPGDFLIFQLESAYGLLRVLAIEEDAGGKIWHVAGYSDFYIDVDSADRALEEPGSLAVSHPHIPLTNRAFESTQVAKMKNVPLGGAELTAFEQWKADPAREVSDRSVRLMLGLR